MGTQVDIKFREFVEKYEVEVSFDNKQRKVKLDTEFLPANQLAKNKLKLTLQANGSFHEAVTLQFSCSLAPKLCSFQIDSKTGRINATLVKQTDIFNRGPSALPMRYIEKEELLPFSGHVAVKEFMDASNLINLMFMSPQDFMLKKAKRKYDTKITDPFYCLRETIAVLWNDVFDAPEVNTYTYKYVEDKFNEKPYTAKFDTQLKGCYLFRGMPFLRLTFIDISKGLEFSGKSPVRENIVRVRRSETLIYDPKTGYPILKTVFVSEQEHLLAWRLMFTNSLRLRQECKNRSADDWHWDTYLPMLFRRETHCRFFDWKTEMAELQLDPGAQQPAVHRIFCASCTNTVSPREAVGCGNNCDAVTYCSHSCQRADWPRHKASCRKSITDRESKSVNKSAVPSGEACASCGKASSSLKKCTRCQNVSYCDRKCQQADWSSHKAVCQEAAKQPTTTTDDKPRSENAKEVCASCCKPSENLKKCARCREVSYCDKTCQLGHWSTHKITCRPR